MKAEGLEWYRDYGRGDDGYFECHPAITGLMSGVVLKEVRDKVINGMGGLTDVRCIQWWDQLWQSLR